MKRAAFDARPSPPPAPDRLTRAGPLSFPRPPQAVPFRAVQSQCELGIEPVFWGSETAGQTADILPLVRPT